MKNRNGKFLYADLADRIQAQIEKGAFKLSEKLPSLRTLCQETVIQNLSNLVMSWTSGILKELIYCIISINCFRYHH